MIDRANEIIEQYKDLGLSLTLRQLYYQFVSRDLISNTEKSYRSLGQLISNARICGKISWTAIVDRERECIIPSTWRNSGHIVDSAARSFKMNLWLRQRFYVEVWVEKKSLVEIIASNDTPYFACKGYTSSSSIWEAAQRFRAHMNLPEIPTLREPAAIEIEKEIEFNYNNHGEDYKSWELHSTPKVPVVLYLGDHDPSGLDMTRDIKERLQMFQAPALIKRIGLNWDQIQKYQPPPNPAKVTDSRFSEYQANYGDESWELDALSPEVLQELVRGSIDEFKDKEQWAKDEEEQEAEREELRNIARELRMKKDA
jgi:hypothetical protein